MHIDERLAGGAYARKQIFSRSRLVAWSHRGRFELGRTLAAASGGGRLLDYGCGDGTFVATVRGAFRESVGTDMDAAQLADCAARFRELWDVAFVPLEAIRSGLTHAAAYDVVTCMEVLEHCVDDVRASVLADLRRLVRPGGRVIISVPIEIGPSLIAKQVARRLAAWRGIGDYRFSERYAPGELARMFLSGRPAPIDRPVYRRSTLTGHDPYHGHKGFDWRVVDGELRGLFDVDAVRFSPAPLFGRWLNSQVWWICRPR